MSAGPAPDNRKEKREGVFGKTEGSLLFLGQDRYREAGTPVWVENAAWLLRLHFPGRSPSDGGKTCISRKDCGCS